MKFPKYLKFSSVETKSYLYLSRISESGDRAVYVCPPENGDWAGTVEFSNGFYLMVIPTPNGKISRDIFPAEEFEFMAGVGGTSPDKVHEYIDTANKVYSEYYEVHRNN